ncbi:metal ABC transporter permease [Ignatzschineria rhizosphaerae]|uniref:Metal ABC transporter permease n=1 Tax=Ignatzschineria rhizosphaerae TaxID=2923279 RepID=A0ABY3X8D3_9GAMM|nr:metal ABC transporter permease [Ignatzschineria rhizosphaerae]UNM97020.1 metal ABC transporter permease [Ignatzschineria rhizosphaerae]
MIESFIMTPLQYPFMQQAMLGAIIAGIVCAVLSCYLILKGWALMGDAISHAVLPGIVVAFIFGIPLVIGAFASGLFCAVATGYIKSHSRVKEDAVLGIIFSGLFALGLFLFSFVKTDQHLTHVLFGNILGILPHELWQIIIISGITLLIILIKRKDFMLYSFDPVQAQVIGLPVKFLHYTLLILLALSIVASLQAVGVILVIAMLVAPGIIGFLLTKRFPIMMIIAVTSSIFSSFMGVLVSFHIDAETGPCIVLSQASLFILAFIYNRIKGRLVINAKKEANEKASI